MSNDIIALNPEELNNQILKEIYFIGMNGYGEEIIETNQKAIQTTWGILLVTDLNKYHFSWASNTKYGDPYFLDCSQFDERYLPDNAFLFTVDNSIVNKFLNTSITSVISHYYETNYATLDNVYYNVRWSVEIIFGNNYRILIGAMLYDKYFEHLICADEIVTLIDNELIDKCVNIWSSQGRQTWSK